MVSFKMMIESVDLGDLLIHFQLVIELEHVNLNMTINVISVAMSSVSSIKILVRI